MQKPLSGSIDDEDLDQMLREQEREGDPIANFIKKNQAEEKQHKKVRPRCNGPAPSPNRFHTWPGYCWDGVDRYNGFKQALCLARQQEGCGGACLQVECGGHVASLRLCGTVVVVSQDTPTSSSNACLAGDRPASCGQF
ncbi:BUD13 homolog [Lemmus lemmus]